MVGGLQVSVYNPRQIMCGGHTPMGDRVPQRLCFMHIMTCAARAATIRYTHDKGDSLVGRMLIRFAHDKGDTTCGSHAAKAAEELVQLKGTTPSEGRVTRRCAGIETNCGS